MTAIDNIIKKIDEAQKQRPALGFPLAVIKKFGDDQAGYKAALLAFYGFLSLFPLLLVLTTVLKMVLGHHAALRGRIIDGATTYFPVVGADLQHNIHSYSKTGLALAIGIVLTLYGARGVANAFRSSVDQVWLMPRSQRLGFPLTILNNFILIVVGGVGLIAASLLTGWSTTAGNLAVSLLLVACSLLVLFALFFFLIKSSLPGSPPPSRLWVGAAVIAVGLAVLQALGGYLVTHQLKHLSNLYGTFAVVLGLFFWISLQTQIILYALEIESVRIFKLWPRSLVADKLTPQDEQAYRLYAKRDEFTG